MRATACFLAICMLMLSTPPARAADPDPWFGADKAKHFAATSLLAAGGYAGASLFDERTSIRLISGGSLAMGVGIAKELWDLSGRGDPSWRDLTWDAIGTATGLLLSAWVDWMWRSWMEPAAAR